MNNAAGLESPSLLLLGEGELVEPCSRLITDGCSLAKLGCLLAGLVARAMKDGGMGPSFLGVLRGALLQGSAGYRAMHRPPKREAFPIRLGELEPLLQTLQSTPLSGEAFEGFCSRHAVDCWTLLSIWFCNSLHGIRHVPTGKWGRVELTAVLNLRASVERVLANDAVLQQDPQLVKKELSSRFVNYSGDEIPKMEPLCLAQVSPALPPLGHGGSVNALEWVAGRTKDFLTHPEQCLLVDDGRKLPPLQAKVHIVRGEEAGLAKALVEHGVCDWVELDRVVCYRNQKVLNGLFGVPKPSKLANGLPCLRVIMNLIPLNSILATLTGKVSQLPGVTQYLSLVLSKEETLSISQLDMTSAFYLFSLPSEWRYFMAFNLIMKGENIGRRPGVSYCLACAVLPMGWSSAVAVMQEISESLLLKNDFDRRLQVHRQKALPSWLTEVLSTSSATSRAWYHVYLDNFMSGERNKSSSLQREDVMLQEKAELAWNAAGVLSSEKKKVTAQPQVEELGALLDGNCRILGVTATRLIKLLHTTWFIINEDRPPVKWLQVVCGRWIHVLQFRRTAMCTLQQVWKVISGAKKSRASLAKAKLELFQLMTGCCLLHTHLGASISAATTASDASSTGGAVGVSRSLTSEGEDFVRATSGNDPVSCSALVISLFNGVGGCFRAYDLCGLQPQGMVSVDWCKAANRVTSRRWPQAVLLTDVRDVSEREVRQWLYEYPHVTEIHLWAGFPCVDVSSVRAFRSNLDGKDSGLYTEILRVKDLILRVFGHDFPLLFAVENVASMDQEVVEQLNQIFGVVPYKLQCSDASPISRPRLCWSNVDLSILPGIRFKYGPLWTEVLAVAPFPDTSQWLREDAVWEYDGSGTIFPTCMKSLPRRTPPPRPAGLDRADHDCIARWTSDQFRFPPYQYKTPYVIWGPRGWRLIDSSERELLHGLGYDHTSVCWSASAIKADPVGYEDQRCSLVGDGFSMYSFVLFAWAMGFKWMPPTSYSHLTRRMGMAPGFVAPLGMECPLARRLVYGSCGSPPRTVADLTRVLLTRVNHTGSDVRVTTGMIVNPKAYPRQSAAALWWKWDDVFRCRWGRREHINRLELRSILLALKWRVTHLREFDVRFVHLTDSYVCMSVISKGRSSSLMLTSVLRQLAAWALAFGLYSVQVHVESTENPTDDASRA